MQLAAECLASGALSAHVFAGDLADEDTDKALVDFAIKELKSIDIMVPAFNMVLHRHSDAS